MLEEQKEARERSEGGEGEFGKADDVEIIPGQVRNGSCEDS